MSVVIREIRKDEVGLLSDFLFESIFVHEGDLPPDRSILELDELQVYVKDFGQHKDDLCYVAVVDDVIAGAVWVRDMPDYGHIEDGVPSFAIALYPAYRAQGIGTQLMRRMLDELKHKGYSKASLSCQKANPAYAWYQKLGFELFEDHGEEAVLVINF